MKDIRKIKYYQEVIDNIWERIGVLNERIKKADKIGAFKKEHKYHKLYLELKDKLKQENSYLKDYQRAHKKATGQRYNGKEVEEIKRIFR